MTTIFKQDANIPEELKGKNALPFTDKYANLCPHCLIAQTVIEQKKKFSKVFTKRFVRVVKDAIEQHSLKLFTKKQLMQTMDISHLSNGAMQDYALAILVQLGYIRKEIQTFQNKKGEKKDRNIYIFQSEIKPPICYDKINDRHIKMDWFTIGVKKDYYKKGETNGASDS